MDLFDLLVMIGQTLDEEKQDEFLNIIEKELNKVEKQVA